MLSQLGKTRLPLLLMAYWRHALALVFFSCLQPVMRCFLFSACPRCPRGFLVGYGVHAVWRCRGHGGEISQIKTQSFQNSLILTSDGFWHKDCPLGDIVYFYCCTYRGSKHPKIHKHKKCCSISSSPIVMVTAWSICCHFGLFSFSPRIDVVSHVTYPRWRHNPINTTWGASVRDFRDLPCLCLLTQMSPCVLLSSCNNSKFQVPENVKTFNPKKGDIVTFLPAENMSDKLEMLKCLSPVSPRPSLTVTLEINGNLCMKGQIQLWRTLWCFCLSVQTERQNALWPDYLNFGATHAPVLFMDMPNLTFNMVILGDNLRWRHGWVSDGNACCVSDLKVSRRHKFNGQPFSIWWPTVVTCLSCTSQKWQLSPWTAWCLPPHLFFFIPICKANNIQHGF